MDSPAAVRHRYAVAIAIVVAGSGAARATPTVHVLHDRCTSAGRTISVVVVDDQACVPASEIAVDAPYRARIQTSCIVEIAGPTTTAPSLHARGHVVADLPHAPTAEMPPPPASIAGAGTKVELVPSPIAVDIGEPVIAAYLRATVDGKPSTQVALHVSARGALPRALHWVAPGLAQIELEVPNWHPTIDVIAQHDADTQHAFVAVDRGAPTTVDLDPGSPRLDEAFRPVVRVTTSAGVELAPSEIRLDVAGCARADASSFRCATAGEHVLSVAVAVDDAWVPIDTKVVVVAPPAAVGWQLAARGGLSTGTIGWGGIDTRVAHPIAADLQLWLGVAWQRGTLHSLTLFRQQLDIVDNDFELAAGGEWLHDWLVRWSLHAGVGLSAAEQHGGYLVSTSSSGLAGLGLAGVGARFGNWQGFAISVDLDVRGLATITAPTWSRPGGEVMLEVGVARE